MIDIIYRFVDFILGVWQLLFFTSICFCIWICQVESWGLTIEHTQGPPPFDHPHLHHRTTIVPLLSTSNQHCIEHITFTITTSQCLAAANQSFLFFVIAATREYSLYQDFQIPRKHGCICIILVKNILNDSDGNKIACFILVPDPKIFLVLQS